MFPNALASALKVRNTMAQPVSQADGAAESPAEEAAEAAPLSAAHHHAQAMKHLRRAHGYAGNPKGALAVHLKLARHAMAKCAPGEPGY